MRTAIMFEQWLPCDAALWLSHVGPLSHPSVASALRRSCLAWLVAQSTAAIQAVVLPSYLAVVEPFRVTIPTICVGRVAG